MHVMNREIIPGMKKRVHQCPL